MWVKQGSVPDLTYGRANDVRNVRVGVRRDRDLGSVRPQDRQSLATLSIVVVVEADAVRKRLSMLLLLIIDVEPTYGYDVIRQLRERSGDEFDLPEGTIYPALHRLHRDGHLEVSEGPATPDLRDHRQGPSPDGGRGPDVAASQGGDRRRRGQRRQGAPSPVGGALIELGDRVRGSGGYSSRVSRTCASNHARAAGLDCMMCCSIV